MPNCIETLRPIIESCTLCPRLVHYRETVPPKKQFAACPFWRKPVSGFGDPEAKLLILGLAPSADGANRTGRIFTGDPSARFLMRALFETGFSNQPDSESKNDGLLLYKAYMTPVVKCVPPDNKPSLLEIRTCRRYLVEEFQCLKSLKTVLALGSVAFYSYLKLAESLGESVKASFKHGAIVRFVTLPTLFASYHPSPQNTYTGKLTLPMLKDVLTTAEREWQGL